MRVLTSRVPLLIPTDPDAQIQPRTNKTGHEGTFGRLPIPREDGEAGARRPVGHATRAREGGGRVRDRRRGRLRGLWVTRDAELCRPAFDPAKFPLDVNG